MSNFLYACLCSLHFGQNHSLSSPSSSSAVKLYKACSSVIVFSLPTLRALEEALEEDETETEADEEEGELKGSDKYIKGSKTMDVC